MSGRKALPWLKWFPRDYIAATRHMSLAERGAYSDLLFLSWEIGPLPTEPERLARLLGCTLEELKAVWPAISEKFTDSLDGRGYMVNRRLEEVRREAEALNETNVRRASTAGTIRWAKYRKVVGLSESRELPHD